MSWSSRHGFRAPKYGNKKVNLDGMTFDSQREVARWAALQLMQKAGDIRDLQRQVPYVLAPAVRLGPSQRQKPAMRYVADFVYRDLRKGDVVVVEDVKGVQTEVFRVKLHLMKSVHGIDVQMVK